MNNITYVSCFLDIGRGNWVNHARSFDKYFKSFMPYIDLFSNPNIGNAYNMVLFLDSRHVEQVKSYFTDTTKITIIEIDEGWMMDNIDIWKTLNTEHAIMQSQEYKLVTFHRQKFPECNNPKYTLINHSKIDFINYVIDKGISPTAFYAWVDFGYFGELPERVPKKLIDPKKLASDRINYSLLSMLDSDTDSNPIYTLIKAPERIGGFFFYGSRDNMKRYQQYYHKALYFFQNVLKIADDDQALVVWLYHMIPDFFALHYTKMWHTSLVDFQYD